MFKAKFDKIRKHVQHLWLLVMVGTFGEKTKLYYKIKLQFWVVLTL